MNEFIVSHISLVLIVILLLLATVAVLLFLLMSAQRRMKDDLSLFMTGSDAKNLESTILSQIKHTKRMSQDLQELGIFNKKIHDLANKGLYKVGFLRFNPFKEVGGDQSFAIALLDGKKNGVVISSLYTKEGSRMYAKPIQDGLEIPQYPLTEEEQRAVSIAHSQKYTSQEK